MSADEADNLGRVKIRVVVDEDLLLREVPRDLQRPLLDHVQQLLALCKATGTSLGLLCGTRGTFFVRAVQRRKPDVSSGRHIGTAREIL